MTQDSSKIFLVPGLFISKVITVAFFSGVLGNFSLTVSIVSIVRFLAICKGKGKKADIFPDFH